MNDLKLPESCLPRKGAVKMTISHNNKLSLVLWLSLAASFSCVSCDEGNYGNVYVDNHSGTDIVIQYPIGSKASALIPAHSKKLALTHVMLGNQTTLTDIRDARTNKLLFKASTDPRNPIESRWFEQNDLHVSYRPKH